MKNITLYAIQNENGEILALDDRSKGYPYVTSDPALGKFWKTEENAAKYISIIKWNDRYNDWKIVEVTMSFRVIDNDEIKDVMWDIRNGSN